MEYGGLGSGHGGWHSRSNVCVRGLGGHSEELIYVSRERVLRIRERAYVFDVPYAEFVEFGTCGAFAECSICKADFDVLQAQHTGRGEILVDRWQTTGQGAYRSSMVFSITSRLI